MATMAPPIWTQTSNPLGRIKFDPQPPVKLDTKVIASRDSKPVDVADKTPTKTRCSALDDTEDSAVTEKSEPKTGEYCSNLISTELVATKLATTDRAIMDQVYIMTAAELEIIESFPKKDADVHAVRAWLGKIATRRCIEINEGKVKAANGQEATINSVCLTGLDLHSMGHSLPVMLKNHLSECGWNAQPLQGYATVISIDVHRAYAAYNPRFQAKPESAAPACACGTGCRCSENAMNADVSEDAITRIWKAPGRGFGHFVTEFCEGMSNIGWHMKF